MSPPPAAPREVAARAFLVRAADALHRFGTPSHRLEAAVVQVASALGLEARVWSTPTGLWLGTGPLDDQRVTMLRVQPAGVDLGRMVALDELMRKVGTGELGAAEAAERLQRVLDAPPRWGAASRVGAGALASAGGAVLFGGSASDVVLGAALGLAVAGLEVSSSGRPWLERMLLTLAALGVTVAARAAAGWVPDVHPAIVVLSSVIVLLPGLSFTVSLVELATANLASGVARMAAAMVTLLRLALGAAIGQHLVQVGASLPPALPVPGWGLPVALALSPSAFGVALGVRRRDLGVVWVASLAGYAGAVFGADALGPEVGAGVGSFALGVVSNVYARAWQRPSSPPLVTGILLLVPGSFGFRSLSALLEGDVLLGVEQAFQMAMVATSLAAGLLLAASVLPPQRAL